MFDAKSQMCTWTCAGRAYRLIFRFDKVVVSSFEKLIYNTEEEEEEKLVVFVYIFFFEKDLQLLLNVLCSLERYCSYLSKFLLFSWKSPLATALSNNLFVLLGNHCGLMSFISLYCLVKSHKRFVVFINILTMLWDVVIDTYCYFYCSLRGHCRLLSNIFISLWEGTVAVYWCIHPYFGRRSWYLLVFVPFFERKTLFAFAMCLWELTVFFLVYDIFWMFMYFLAGKLLGL